MDKVCRKCNVVKEITEFHRDKIMKDGHKNICKPCAIEVRMERYWQNHSEERARWKKYYNAPKDGYHRVYLLEDYNYVGVTDCLRNRFKTHKKDFNYDCTNHKVLFKSKDRNECLKIEAKYHEMGYNGGDSKHASYR